MRDYNPAILSAQIHDDGNNVDYCNGGVPSVAVMGQCIATAKEWQLEQL